MLEYDYLLPHRPVTVSVSVTDPRDVLVLREMAVYQHLCHCLLGIISSEALTVSACLNMTVFPPADGWYLKHTKICCFRVHTHVSNHQASAVIWFVLWTLGLWQTGQKKHVQEQDTISVPRYTYTLNNNTSLQRRI